MATRKTKIETRASVDWLIYHAKNNWYEDTPMFAEIKTQAETLKYLQELKAEGVDSIKVS